MKPQPQGHLMDSPYHQEDIKSDAILFNKARSPLQYQDGDSVSYSEKEALKQLPEASSWPKFSGTQHLKVMLVYGTQKLKKSMAGETGHGGGVKLSKSTAMVLRYGKQPCHSKRTNTLWKNIHMSDKPKERVEEVTKKKNSCHNCGSTDHYANNCPKAKKKVYAIEKVPEEDSPTEDSDSDSMGDAIKKQSDEEQDQREEFLVKYQEETSLEIQDIQLEEGIPQDTANKNLCKHTQDSQIFLFTPTKGMAYIHGTATKMTVCIDNAQHPLIIYTGAHCSLVARNYLDNHFPNWEKQLLPTKAKNFESASGKMTSIGTIIEEIIIPHKKGNIRLNPEFVVLDDAHIQRLLLGTYYL
ncbi:hypothetical protein O181_064658 [Austropuccinia psidii MF-1]|uniref:CCHC-type domain-containing protein n=1 Tax=Austropuccinia psidii MF-1 TaxID=1389203 RepID=A0A9Q3ENC6_9BASI|nr:hypothetical protein [Austropuccinia psidii MF-1]